MTVIRMRAGPRRPCHAKRAVVVAGPHPARTPGETGLAAVRPTPSLRSDHGQETLPYRAARAGHRPTPRRSLGGGDGCRRVEHRRGRRAHARRVREGLLRRVDRGRPRLALPRSRVRRPATAALLDRRGARQRLRCDVRPVRLACRGRIFRPYGAGSRSRVPPGPRPRGATILAWKRGRGASR